MRARPLLLLGGLLLSACVDGPAEGDIAGLDRDYVLSTTDPAFVRTNPIRLRYEDDWVPRTCEGVTYRSPSDNIIIEWRCALTTSPGTSVGRAYFTGGLSDPDGDGTFAGTLVGHPLAADDSIGDPVAAEFTMEPCASNGGSGPCM